MVLERERERHLPINKTGLAVVTFGLTVPGMMVTSRLATGLGSVLGVGSGVVDLGPSRRGGLHPLGCE